MRQFGTYFGLPADVGPRTWDEFLSYYEQMLADPAMGSSDVSRAMAWAVAAPDRPWWLRLTSRPGAVRVQRDHPAAGARPPRLPQHGVVEVRDRPDERLDAAGRSHLLPSPLRYAPQYRLAMRKMRETASHR